MSPYFDATNFDPTYFDTGGTPSGDTGGGGPRRVLVPPTEPHQVDDGDELFALF